MSEHSEHPAEGTPPPGERTSPAHPAPAEGDVIGTAPHGPAPARPPSRFRHWSANASVRMGAVAVVAGLIGGLVGGGIVAAFSDDGHDRVKPMRFERGGPRGGPGFRVPPYYWGPYGRMVPPRQVQPTTPPTTAPTPSPKATG
jgi:hypothetical protein